MVNNSIELSSKKVEGESQPGLVKVDLEKAKTILATIVGIKESEITSDTDLMRIGDYSVEEVRAAFMVTAKDIVGAPDSEWPKLKQPHFGIRPYGSGTKYSSNGGRAKLGLHSRQASYTELYPEPNELSLDYEELGSHGYPIRTEMNYSSPQEPTFSEADAQKQTQFIRADYNRSSAHLGTSVDQMSTDSRDQNLNPLDHYRVLFRGMRWMAANMLNWKTGGFIIESDLDKVRLGQPAKQTTLKQPHNIVKQ